MTPRWHVSCIIPPIFAAKLIDIAIESCRLLLLLEAWHHHYHWLCCDFFKRWFGEQITITLICAGRGSLGRFGCCGWESRSMFEEKYKCFTLICLFVQKLCLKFFQFYWNHVILLKLYYLFSFSFFWKPLCEQHTLLINHFLFDHRSFF